MNTIRLRAFNESRNINRIYEINQSRGLYDLSVVSLRWGREGTRGQTKTIGFDTRSEALKYVNNVLRKRLTAERRIGINYQLVD